MARPKFRRREWVAIVVGITVLFFLGVLPVLQKARKAHDGSRARVEQARDRLQDAQELRALIEAERSGQEAVKRKLMTRPPNFDLFSFTTRALHAQSLFQRANVSNNPRRTGGKLEEVQVDLKGINMKELVDFLHQMYDGGNLIVLQKLDDLKPARDGNGLECHMTFISPDT